MADNFYASYPVSGGGIKVTSLNSLSGALTLAGGAGITITDNGTNTITVASHAALSLGAFGSTPNANGLTLTGQVLNMQPADASNPGGLTATDWNTFNNKQPAGNYITALTGDATASGPGSVALTLATVNSGVGAFGSATQVPSITVNGKGLVTAAANTSIQIAESQVTNLTTDLAGKQPVGSYITALTGDATASGPGSAALTLATVNSNTGSFGSSTAIPSFTVNGKGLITAASTNAVVAPAGTLTGTTLASGVVTSSLTAVGTIATGNWSATTIALNKGGTGQTTKAAAFDALSPMTTGGDLIYGGASGTGTRLANGSAGQVLTSAGTTLAPTWSALNLGTAASITGTLPVGNGGTGAAAFTTGSVVFAGGSGVYTQDNANLFWDDTNNFLGVGTASPGVRLHTRYSSNTGPGVYVDDTTPQNGQTFIAFRCNTTQIGAITGNGTNTTTYGTSSDYRLKTDMRPMFGSLDRLMHLKPYAYTWLSDGSDGEGFLAHELQHIVPLAVVGAKDAVYPDGSIKAQNVDYSRVVPLLVAALQDLKNQFDEYVLTHP